MQNLDKSEFWSSFIGSQEKLHVSTFLSENLHKGRYDVRLFLDSNNLQSAFLLKKV